MLPMCLCRVETKALLTAETAELTHERTAHRSVFNQFTEKEEEWAKERSASASRVTDLEASLVTATARADAAESEIVGALCPPL